MREGKLRSELHGLFSIGNAGGGIEPITDGGNLQARRDALWGVLDFLLEGGDGSIDVIDGKKKVALGVVNVWECGVLIDEVRVSLTGFLEFLQDDEGFRLANAADDFASGHTLWRKIFGTQAQRGHA